MPSQTDKYYVYAINPIQGGIPMRKQALRWNKHMVIQLIMAMVASVLLGALVGRGLVMVSKTTAFKERRAALISAIKGDTQIKYRRVASEPYRSQRLSSN